MKVKSRADLPKNYREIWSLDLLNDKKELVRVNGFGGALMVLLLLLGHILVPVSALFDLENGFLPYALRFGVMLGGTFVYLILHELVHGVFMYRFSGVRPRYGFNGVYAYAGSDACFSKTHYIVIALAPVVVWGIVLAVLTALVPAGWFWPVWFIQVTNLSGAAGDLYVTWRFAALPADILVRDSGVAMTVYVPESGEKTTEV